MLRSFVGFFTSVAEDPELILEQTIRDMNDQVPPMNESIAMAKAIVTLLEKEEAQYNNDINDLTAKVKAAIKGRHNDLAGGFAEQLEQVHRALARTQGQLTVARSGSDKAVLLKQTLLREKHRRTEEALNTIRDNRRAQWQKKVADALEHFEGVGIKQSHDETVRKIEEMAAVNDARIAMAQGKVDEQKVKIEEAAQKLRASKLVKQFKVEMGLAVRESPAARAKRTVRRKKQRKTS